MPIHLFFQASVKTHEPVSAVPPELSCSGFRTSTSYMHNALNRHMFRQWTQARLEGMFLGVFAAQSFRLHSNG